MNALLISVAAQWIAPLRGMLARRGHTLTIIDDPRNIASTVKQGNYSLAFVGLGKTVDEVIKICRQLRSGSGATPLQILVCGDPLQSDKMQALLTAGVNDCLTDPDNDDELELRLALAEFRASRSAESVVMKQSSIVQNDSGFSIDGNIEAIAIQSCGSADLKQAETAIQIDQQNLQSLSDTFRDMIFVLDETGRLLHANPMVSKRLGYTPAELSNMNIEDLHPPERRQESRNRFSQILAGRTVLCEIPLLAKNGTQIPVETVVVRGKWGNIDRLFGVSRDLSERHRVSRELHESESRFRVIFESAAVGLALGDMQGIVSEVNGALTEMLGYTPEEFIGKRYTEFTHPDDLESVQSIMRELLDGKSAKILFERRFIHKNGSIVWGRLNASLLRDPDGTPRYFIIIVENISDRILAEDQLKENEAFIRKLFENLPDFVILVDQNAKILYANHDPPDLTKEQMIGEEAFAFVDDAYQVQCREAFAAGLSTRKVQKVEILDMFNRFWSLVLVPFVYEDVVRQAMVICTDITEQRQAAEEIQKEQQLLRRVIDIHERDRQMTAYEIHDGVAQQVTASLYYLEAFRNMRKFDKTAAETSLEIAIKLITQSVDETRRLISGLRPLILDEYGIVEAVEYLVCEHRERSGMQIDFHHEIQFKHLVPPLESAVFRIVQEALTNACRHSKSAIVSVELVEREDRLHIKVKDQGVGFDPNTVEETCFGLRSIRERARLLDGEAEIQSAPGSGTCITVELPVVLQAEEISVERNLSDN